ncbi:ABC transporter ATP-binding protein [Sandaracinobacteroides saxicola]|uniref:ABC transporter ATP-binding protein n=1 Tax=Sandaracinobacteroides saxicola TaxID=2759707 RepID=A0A7G5IIT2_9SPHN|nr:ABC transporter ATP-binding protein [Sandaracinobacteroides saxicola]QMW23274.1 ABC transporter ATP-binding protein [Sandaracinobacteroides saxicola]
MQANIFTLSGIAKRYARGDDAVTIFDGLDMDIARGAFIALMGPSGSGKTTLLNLLGGIDRPDSGELRYDGRRIDSMSEAELTVWRARHVGFVFQSFNLLPMLTAARNVELPLTLTDLGRAERERRVGVALDLVGLGHCGHRPPSQLSGGQQQRVAIARAIVADTEVLLCDEPTGNLDRNASTEVLELLRTLNEELGKTIIMVTHDRMAADHARTTLALDKGRFVDAAVPA